jgi:hypothetical protein
MIDREPSNALGAASRPKLQDGLAYPPRGMNAADRAPRVVRGHQEPGADMESTPIEASAIRFAVKPRDVPAKKAARRLHLTEAEFLAKLDPLFARGFPRPDPTTGNYDLVKIDRWMDDRNTPSTRPDKPRDARELLVGRFH